MTQLKKTFFKTICRLAVPMLLCGAFGTADAGAVRLHTPADSLKAMEIVGKFSNPGGSPATIVDDIAAIFVGEPYHSWVRTDTTGVLEFRLDGFDELSFVNTVGALARTATQPGTPILKDVEDNFVALSCRRGEEAGFPSVMIYGADWAVDNRGRGNVAELTESYSDLFKTRSLDYVSRHRDEFPALADSLVYENQKLFEMGYRSHKLPHMKRQSFEWKDTLAELAEGDVVMLLGNDPDFDYVTVGFAVRRDDGWHLLHASKEEGKVVVEPLTLARYLRKNAARIYGFRWFRFK